MIRVMKKKKIESTILDKIEFVMNLRINTIDKHPYC